jgi:cellulose synthase/poly-beta-1,6-N-acetylglucosamine synthase-like glycosyltransferase
MKTIIHENSIQIINKDGKPRKQMEKRGEISLFLRNKERGGKASAANFALRYCKGKYIVHFDADCSFDRDAIEKVLVPFYVSDKVGAVSGNLEVRNHTESLATTFQAIEYLMYISVGRSVASFLGLLRIVSGAFGAFRKDILDQLGGWDVGPGLDGDITIKIRKLGYNIYFETNAVAHTSVPNTFGKLARQRYRWDRSLVRFRLRKHRDVLNPNQNFSILNMLSVFENLVYNLGFTFIWYVYLFEILINYTPDLGYILVMSTVLYTISRFAEFFVVLSLDREPIKKMK